MNKTIRNFALFFFSLHNIILVSTMKNEVFIVLYGFTDKNTLMLSLSTPVIVKQNYKKNRFVKIIIVY